MSRIYDALKRAQAERAKAKDSKTDSEFDRRRTQRIALQVPVFVYGHGRRQEPFHEETTSLVVNSHGALLPLSNRVRLGQELLLTNPATQSEQPCRVVFLASKRSRRNKVGVAFAGEAPSFWALPGDSNKNPVA
ncbi:MAG TPA: hypothetical protein VLV89_13215 [Candidatus Acidoferrum sp.]|nr:hypothetical protein [Candidatus Acidoferrum sp.]